MAQNLNQPVPITPALPIASMPGGQVTQAWYSFFVSLWNRTGGSIASITPLLDTLSSTVGALIYRGSSGWTGLDPGSEYQVLREGANSEPAWSLIDGNSFAVQAENTFFAGPTGAEGTATFRLISTADLDNTRGEYPGESGSGNASHGNIGEYISSSVALASAVALTTTVAADITTINLTAGDWDVWANVVVTALPTTLNAWIGSASVTDPTAPNGGAYLSVGNQTSASPVGAKRVSLGGPATLYLSVNATFGGSLSGYGFLGARRAR